MPNVLNAGNGVQQLIWTRVIPETHLWEQLDDERKRIVVETLARLMTNASRTDQHQEQTND